MKARHREHGHIAFVTGLNFHGVGEFIATYEDGSASSEFCADYELLDGVTWADVEARYCP